MVNPEIPADGSVAREYSSQPRPVPLPLRGQVPTVTETAEVAVPGTDRLFPEESVVIFVGPTVVEVPEG